MHAEPIAALDALKLASLALQSTHSSAMGFPPERRETTLIAPIARNPCEKCGLGVGPAMTGQRTPPAIHQVMLSAPERHTWGIAQAPDGD
jgi:hypothetical protein